MWRATPEDEKRVYKGQAEAFNDTNGTAGPRTSKGESKMKSGHLVHVSDIESIVKEAVGKAFAERPQPPPQAALDPMASIKAANNLLYNVDMCNVKREYDTKKTKIIMQKRLDYLESQTFEDNGDDELFSMVS